tara:strand:+ start:336 stop:656 length:321 start_codon:yes stop_codon:yes gene_type:complete
MVKKKKIRAPLLTQDSKDILKGLSLGLLFVGVVSLPIILTSPTWAEHKYARGTRVTLENKGSGRVLECVSTRAPSMAEYKVRIHNSDGTYTEVLVFEDEILNKESR